MEIPKSKTVNTYTVKIYVSGPLAVIEQTCRKFCRRGYCVTVDPTKFIYTGGEETGAVIGLVNYPRFPKDEAEIRVDATELALMLIEDTYQDSALIVTPETTTWLTKRTRRENV